MLNTRSFRELELGFKLSSPQMYIQWPLHIECEYRLQKAPALWGRKYGGMLCMHEASCLKEFCIVLYPLHFPHSLSFDWISIKNRTIRYQLVRVTSLLCLLLSVLACFIVCLHLSVTSTCWFMI